MTLFNVITKRELTYEWQIEAESADEAARDAKESTYDGVNLDNPINDFVEVEDCYEAAIPSAPTAGEEK